MSELRKCPFCGGEAEIVTKFGRHGYFVTVECVICGAQTKGFSTGEYNSNGEKAIKRAEFMWNRRMEEQNE